MPAGVSTGAPAGFIGDGGETGRPRLTVVRAGRLGFDVVLLVGKLCGQGHQARPADHGACCIQTQDQAGKDQDLLDR